MTRLIEVSVAEPFRLSLAGFIEDIMREVEGSIASEGADPSFRERLPEYLEWARTCLGRIGAADGDYVTLDESDMATLSSDVLPSMMARANRDMQAIIEDEYDKEALLTILRDMRSANTLCSRLFQIMNHDIFNEDFRGDRENRDVHSAISAC